MLLSSYHAGTYQVFDKACSPGMLRIVQSEPPARQELQLISVHMALVRSLPVPGIREC